MRGNIVKRFVCQGRKALFQCSPFTITHKSVQLRRYKDVTVAGFSLTVIVESDLVLSPSLVTTQVFSVLYCVLLISIFPHAYLCSHPAL